VEVDVDIVVVGEGGVVYPKDAGFRRGIAQVLLLS
jgi:hypothetical protein